MSGVLTGLCLYMEFFDQSYNTFPVTICFLLTKANQRSSYLTSKIKWDPSHETGTKPPSCKLLENHLFISDDKLVRGSIKYFSCSPRALFRQMVFERNQAVCLFVTFNIIFISDTFKIDK